jgi:hypothetical protein
VLQQYVGGVDVGDGRRPPVLHQGICNSPHTLQHIARESLAALNHLHS